jgi:hypothetical protein
MSASAIAIVHSTDSQNNKCYEFVVQMYVRFQHRLSIDV